MKLLNRLERIFGQFAIPNITLFIICLQSLTYILWFGADAHSPDRGVAFLGRIALVGNEVFHGEVWRIFTFVVMPPVTNPIFFFFAMMLLFLMGTALENHWGTFRYNIFLLVGWLGSVGMALLLPSFPASNGYLIESILLAFAYLYPDFIIQLFFFFPVKVKWIALVVWIAYLFQFSVGGWLDKCLILVATANFLLFFHRELWQSALVGHQRMLRKARTIKPPTDDAFHRCRICGVTERSNPKMEFRYCPQCAGTPCYCIDHINAHAHSTAGASPG